MKAKPDKTPLKSPSRRTPRRVRRLKWILLGSALGLLLLGHGFSAAWWPRQPRQMWSRVDYDLKLTDPFFKSNGWSRPDYGLKGTPPDRRREERPRLKHTAKCFSNSMGGGEAKHLISFCEASLLDAHVIVLSIHEDGPGHSDSLRVWIRNGMFASHFSDGAAHKVIRVPTRWTPKRQKLVLDKKAYRKGDMIKGKIDFEYIEEIGKHVSIVRVFGVFKTILK